MTDLTLAEKTSFAAHRATKNAAEKHFFDAAQPFHPLGFSISYRNPGHWDIFADCPDFEAQAHNAIQPEKCHTAVSTRGRVRERALRIRGEPGNVIVMDGRQDPHRPFPRESLTFRSITAAMVWISEELMQEPA